MRRKRLTPPQAHITHVAESPRGLCWWLLRLDCGHSFDRYTHVRPTAGNRITCPECERILKSNLDGHRP